jgi:hypothetical protein
MTVEMPHAGSDPIKDYETEAETRAQQRAVEPLMND